MTAMRACDVSFLLLPILFTTSLGASPRTLIVDDDRRDCKHADYQTIHEAVLAADTDPRVRRIKVCPGAYAGEIDIRRSLSIEGAQRGRDGTRRQSAASEESIVTGGGFGFRILADLVEIDGFVIQGMPGTGVFVSAPGSENPTFAGSSGHGVRNNIFKSNGVAVSLASPAAGARLTQVERNLMESSVIAGVFVGTSRPLNHARIEQNRFVNNRFGILLDFLARDQTPPPVALRTNLTIDKNEFQSSSASHVVAYFLRSSIISNNVGDTSAGDGIAVNSGSSQVAVGGNTLMRSRRGISLGHNLARFGIVEWEPHDIVFAANQTTANRQDGILVSGGHSNSVYANRCEDNGRDGINVRISSNHNTIRVNRCVRNGRDGIRLHDVPDFEDPEGAFPGPPFENTVEENVMMENAGFDAFDDTVGVGSAGTANFWMNNNCRTENRVGLCHSSR